MKQAISSVPLSDVEVTVTSTIMQVVNEVAEAMSTQTIRNVNAYLIVSGAYKAPARPPPPPLWEPSMLARRVPA